MYRLITGFDNLESTQDFKRNYKRIVALKLDDLRKESRSTSGRFIAATTMMNDINGRFAHLNRNLYS